MRTPRPKIPLELIEKPLAEAWSAVDAMWRVELLGDATLTQQWRTARNKLATAKERFRDLLRLAEYLGAHGSKSDHSKQAAATKLRANGKPAGASEDIPGRIPPARSSSPPHRRARRN